MSTPSSVTRRRWSTVAAAALVALAGPALAAAPASAATGVPSSLSDVRVTDGSLSATLVLRSSAKSLTVDPASVKVTVGGKPAKASVKKASGEARSTMLVIDTSGSMEASGMATVRAAVKQFLSNVPEGVKVGMVSFASTAGVDVAPTTNRAKVSRAVSGLESKGETALYEAIQDAVRGLGTSGERSIVLLSDGGDSVAEIEGGTAGEKSERQAALRALKRAKVRAEVVAFKSPESNQAVLVDFAKAGGGSVVNASNTEAVSSAFAVAARALESQAVLTVERPAGVVGDQPVVVSGTASGQPFTLTQSVDLGDTAPAEVDPEPTPSDAPVQAGVLPAGPTSAVNPALLLPAIGVFFLGIFVFGLAMSAPLFRTKRSERIQAVEAYGFGQTAKSGRQTPSPTALSEQLIHMGDKVMEGRESTTKTMALLIRADLPWRAGEWLVLRFIAVVVAGAAGFLLFPGSQLIGMVIGVLAGVVLPPLALRFVAKRRSRRFEELLPDVMMLVATSLASGFSLLQALDSVAKDAAEPAAKEFSRALAESRIGSDVSDALDKMAVRMDSSNMRWTTMAIRIQREVGGNLAETLRTTAQTLREREMLRRQVRALSAEGRLSAYILIALPIGLFLYMMWVNYSYISLLWTNLIGIGMLVMGSVSLVIGIFWMRKVVNIEV